MGDPPAAPPVVLLSQSLGAIGTTVAIETKRILFVYFSQSGQLARVAQAIAAPLVAAGHDVSLVALEPERPFPFPWPFWQFLDAFPESVALDSPALKPWRADGRSNI